MELIGSLEFPRITLLKGSWIELTYPFFEGRLACTKNRGL